MATRRWSLPKYTPGPFRPQAQIVEDYERLAAYYRKEAESADRAVLEEGGRPNRAALRRKWRREAEAYRKRAVLADRRADFFRTNTDAQQRGDSLRREANERRNQALDLVPNDRPRAAELMTEAAELYGVAADAYEEANALEYAAGSRRQAVEAREAVLVPRVISEREAIAIVRRNGGQKLPRVGYDRWVVMGGMNAILRRVPARGYHPPTRVYPAWSWALVPAERIL